MARLPERQQIIDANLYGLEQYLAWGITELRRLAIADNQQQLARITFTSEIVKSGEENKLEGVYRSDVSLPYDSDLALSYGLSFLHAVKEIVPGVAGLPNYTCPNRYGSTIKQQLNIALNPIYGIDTLEKFVYWLCLSWQLSVTNIEAATSTGEFKFLEEQKPLPLVAFTVRIPADYVNSLKENIVCSVYPSPYRAAISYRYPKLIAISQSSEENGFSLGNISELNNSSELNNNGGFYLEQPRFED